MALNFPPNPIVGQVYKVGTEQWVWNGTAWNVVPTPDAYSPVSIGQNPPIHGVLAGDLWWDSFNGRLYIYYQDENSAQWVAATQIPDPIVEVTSDQVVTAFNESLTPYVNAAAALAAGVPNGGLWRVTGEVGSSAIRALISNSGTGVFTDLSVSNEFTYQGVLITADAAEFNSLDGVTSNLQVQLNTLAATDGNIYTLAGVPSGSLNLGTFTGSVIPADQTIKQALQALETALGDGSADEKADALILQSGMPALSTNLGVFTGTLIPSASTTKAAIQLVETATESLVTLSGQPANAQNLGTFTGSTIPNDQTIKQALQALETAIESNDGEPGGNSTELQFNNAGAFGGIPGLAFTSGNNTLTAASRINNTNQFMDFTSTDQAQALQIYGNAAKEFDVKIGPDVDNLSITAKFTPGKLTLPSGELDAQEVNATILSGARQGVVYKLVVGTGLTFEGQASTHIGGTVGNDWATSSGTIGVNASVVQITGDANIAGNKKFLADLKVGTALADNLTLGTDGSIVGTGMTIAGLAYPSTDGTNGQVITTDGSGALTFTTVSGGGGTPAGADGELQFNDNGAFGADSNLTWNSTTNVLGAPTVAAASMLTGVLQVSGNTDLGDATSDTISFVGRFDTHLLPTTNADYDLGNAELKIRHLFLSDNSLKIGSSSDATIYVEVGANDSSTNLTVSKGIETVGSILPTINNNADLGSSALKWNNVYGNVGHYQNLNAAGNVNFTNLSDFTDDTAAAAGGIAVGQLYRNGSVVMVRVS